MRGCAGGCRRLAAGARWWMQVGPGTPAESLQGQPAQRQRQRLTGQSPRTPRGPAPLAPGGPPRAPGGVGGGREAQQRHPHQQQPGVWGGSVPLRSRLSRLSGQVACRGSGPPYLQWQHQLALPLMTRDLKNSWWAACRRSGCRRAAVLGAPMRWARPLRGDLRAPPRRHRQAGLRRPHVPRSFS